MSLVVVVVVVVGIDGDGLVLMGCAWAAAEMAERVSNK